MSEDLPHRGTGDFVEDGSGNIIRRPDSHSSSDLRSAQARAQDAGEEYEIPGRVRSLKGYKRPSLGQKPTLDSKAHIATHDDGSDGVVKNPETDAEFDRAFVHGPVEVTPIKDGSNEGVVVSFLNPFDEPEVDRYIEGGATGEVVLIPGVGSALAVMLEPETSDVDDLLYTELNCDRPVEIPLSTIKTLSTTPDERELTVDGLSSYPLTQE